MIKKYINIKNIKTAVSLFLTPFYIRRVISIFIHPKNLQQYFFINNNKNNLIKMSPIFSSKMFDNATTKTIKKIFFRHENIKDFYNLFKLEKEYLDIHGKLFRGISLTPKRWYKGKTILYSYGNSATWQASSNYQLISLALRTKRKIFFFNNPGIFLNNTCLSDLKNLCKYSTSFNTFQESLVKVINPFSNICTSPNILVSSKKAIIDYITKKHGEDLVLYAHSLSGFICVQATYQFNPKGESLVRVFAHNTGISLGRTSRYLAFDYSPYLRKSSLKYAFYNHLLEKLCSIFLKTLFLDVDIGKSSIELYKKGLLMVSSNQVNKNSIYKENFDKVIPPITQLWTHLQGMEQTLSNKISSFEEKSFFLGSTSSTKLNEFTHIAPLRYSFCNNKNDRTQEDRFVMFCNTNFIVKLRKNIMPK